MGRKTADRKKEFTELDKLKKENKILKRQLSRLRKLLDRVDLENYQNLRELVEKQHKEDLEIDKLKQSNRIKQKWQCKKCFEDYLRTYILQKRNSTSYYRRCPTCGHRTKSKQYNKNVEVVE
jgi:rubrerythrin